MFPKTIHVGCYFHFLQAIVRNMTKLNLKRDGTGWAEVLDDIRKLTLSPLPQIPSLIESLKIKHGTTWSKFWSYFVRVWTKKYTPQLWSIQHIIKSQVNYLICNNLKEH
jgi:hypothetical protein